MKKINKLFSGLLSVALLSGMIFVPTAFNVTAADSETNSFNAAFSDAAKYSGGRAVAHADPISKVDAPYGITENSSTNGMENMLILGGTDNNTYPKWYFYNDSLNSAGLGVNKQLLILTTQMGTGVPGMLDYGWGNSGSGGTPQIHKIGTGSGKQQNNKATLISASALNQSEKSVKSISGTARLATPEYQVARTDAYENSYSAGDPVLNGYAGTTFVVSKSSESTDRIYQLVTVNLGISNSALTFSASEMPLTSNNTESDAYGANVVIPQINSNKTGNYNLAAVNSIASASGKELAAYAVNKDGTALSETEMAAVKNYFNSITALNNSLSKFSVTQNSSNVKNVDITYVEEEPREIKDDYKVDYKLSSGSGAYEILLGLNFNGYADYCTENADMPKDGIALKVSGDYFNNTEFGALAKAESLKKQFTTDTPMFGIGSFSHYALPCAVRTDQSASGTSLWVVKNSTAIESMNIDYVADAPSIDTIKDQIAVKALGASVLKNAQLGAGQNLRFGFDFSDLNSYLTSNNDLTLKDYGIYAHVNTCNKTALLADAGNKFSFIDKDLSNTVTVIFNRSEEFAHARISAMAYFVVEYYGQEYTLYSENTDSVAKDGIATKSVIGVIKAEMKEQKAETENAEKISSAVTSANTYCNTEFTIDVLNSTSTVENRGFIKALFYYFFN